MALDEQVLARLPREAALILRFWEDVKHNGTSTQDLEVTQTKP